NYYIFISGVDLGQLLDGLDVHRQAWADTARYLRYGEMPNKTFVCEECSDASEADQIAEHYTRIVETIHRQRTAQDGHAKMPSTSESPEEGESRFGFCIY